MTKWSHKDAYSDDLELITLDLSSALFYGEVALFLGAGVNRPFGLPVWSELVSRCLAAAGLDPNTIKGRSDFLALTAAMGRVRDEIKDNEAYVTVVWHGLYDGYGRTDWVPSNLLTSLGALLMGSRRGRIREVWTFNYDDVLEWYLDLHGFVTQVITETPRLLRDVDVTIYHPHGFVPFDKKRPRSKEIVFDDRSYAKRSVGKAQEWRDAVQVALRSKVFVAIGLSWTDRLLRDLIIDAAEANNDRPTAFWLFGPNASSEDMEDCLRQNVVPVRFPSFDAYGSFLRRLCSEAMRFVRV